LKYVAEALTNIDRPSGCDSENGLQEGRGVGTQDANPRKAMFLQVVRKAPGAIRSFDVRSPQDLIIRRDMVDGLGLSPIEMTG
jgi:hypothetical protein